MYSSRIAFFLLFHIVPHSGAFLAPRWLPRLDKLAATKPINDHDKDQPPVFHSALETEGARALAREKIIACYQTIFASAAVDLVANQWWVRRSMSSQERMWNILAVAWKVVLGRGLYLSSKVILDRDAEDLRDATLAELVDGIFQAMGGVWRQAAAMIVLQSALDTFPVFAQVPYFQPVFWTTAIGSLAAFRIVSTRESAVLATPASSADQDTARKVRIGLRNMALCTAALLLRGSIINPLLMLAPDAGLRERVSLVLETPGIVAAGVLLWQFRAAQLRVMCGALQSPDHALAVDGVRDLMDTQAKFYGRIRHIFQAELRGKLLSVAVPMVRSMVRSTPRTTSANSV